MSKKIKLFEEEELSFKYKFYTLMDLLIGNQADSRVESFLLMGIFYLQIISSFFAENLMVFEPKNSKSDKILNYIEKIIRLKDLFIDNYEYFLILEMIVFILIIFIIFHFLFSCILVTKSSFYSFNLKIINYYLKLFFYVGYNIIFDICFNSFCLGSEEFNPNFNSVKCSSQNLFFIIVSIINIVISLIFYIFLNIYYNDSFYLTNSYYAKMSCNYDVLWGINCMIISLFLAQSKYFTKELFLMYNFIMSIVLFFYYIKHYLYYDKYINIFTGIFHILYAWTSIFSLIFSFLEFKEKGIIYILTSIIICFFYFNIKNRIEAQIFLNTPFYKLTNKFYLLYYFRNIYDLINNVEESYEDKSLLSGIIKMHSIECPNPNCLLKTKEDIYLPLTNKWNDKNKKEIEDEVFLKNFLIIVMNYFLYTDECTADMYLNLSLYYLKIIGNYCQAIYYYKKITELKLSLREEFSFIRLSLQISRALIEKLKPSNEQCTELENLDVSMYYKYEELSQNFLDEINNDVNFSLEFWKAFQAPFIEANKKIDFNKVFELTDKIGKTKKNVEIMWNKLLDIYGGVNDFFELYVEYIEQINDDDLKKRDLESLRRKNDTFGDHMNNNFYSVLFNKDTGIIIANGDKGSVGIIELSNKEIENIFKYKPIDLKGMNLTCLMPKIFAVDHSKYMERYFKIGQKKLIDKSDFKTFGKDKDNSIIKIKTALKLFPVLNDKVYFLGLISKENIDDIIFLDDKFNIQGMSLKLMKILSINNKNLFQDNEIPFYVICRKFVNFYNIFLQGKKKEDTSEKQNTIIEEEKDDDKKEEKKDHKENEKEEDIHENIEINENVELEYEIKLPQFLIDYSEKSNKKEGKAMEIESVQSESNYVSDIIEEYDEEDLLMEEERNREKEVKPQKNNNNNNYSTPTPTPTPDGEAPTPGAAPISDSIDEESCINNPEQNIVFNKESEEEKIYNNLMNKYKTLFNEGKVNELEELIDTCNKNSASVEYKFNFTFDKYRYGNKQISYIVRCIDNKNDIGQSQEESAVDLDPKAAKYKKEKAESIKPLFELLEEERKELLGLPEMFLNLSLENKKFQKLLQSCKNDINIMSKAHGQKKDEVLEDENSSQTSQTGFDSGLVKKNRIEEIRSNLMMNVTNFYTLKYIKIVILLIGICIAFFSGIYIMNFLSLFSCLVNSNLLNIALFQSALWTTEIISIFVSLRVLYLKEIIKVNEQQNYTYYNYITNYEEPNEYYEHCINESLKLYEYLSKSFGSLEMEIPTFLTDEQLDKLYWDKVNVSYMNENYKNFSLFGDEETFPMSIAQLLSNSLSYLHSPVFNSLSEESRIAFFNNSEDNEIYFEYMTFLIIENGYNNILPNQFKKLLKIPEILSKYNLSQTKYIDIIIIIFVILMIILCLAYFILIHLTNKSMTDGMEKVTKIKLEKIEEIIKKIKLFNADLKKFREKDLKTEDNKENSYLLDDDSKTKSGSKNDSNNDVNKKKKKIEQESSLVNSSGFNTDFRRYIPLTKLKYLFLHPVIIFLIFIICIIPIYIYSFSMVANTNQLLLVENYIFGKLITTTTSIIEIKCFISDCKINNLTYDELVNYDIIQNVIKGLNLFDTVSNFYNEKFLLDACAAVYDKSNNKEEYSSCKADPIIETANNTENLLKLIDDLIFNIEKDCEINKNKNNSFYKLSLFGEVNYQQIEKIFFKYLMGVSNNFVSCVQLDLLAYLLNKEFIVIFIIISFTIIAIIYCLITRIISFKNLVHHLNVSRCIMKIIPTSVIISTPELESWIENKY